MEIQQLPLSPEHCMEKTRRGRSCWENCRQKKALQAYDILAGHLWATLIVRNTFVLYLKLCNDIYCERPVQIYSLQVSGKDNITSGHV